MDMNIHKVTCLEIAPVRDLGNDTVVRRVTVTWRDHRGTDQELVLHLYSTERVPLHHLGHSPLTDAY